MPRPLLAVNYSPASRDLHERGALLPDLFKLPAWPELFPELRNRGRFYVHFDLHLGSDGLSGETLREAEAILDETGTFHLNTHFAPRPSPGSLERAHRELAELVRHFGTERILVENVPWKGTLDYPIAREASDPERLARLIEEHGCGFILDLAHARITCLETGCKLGEYLDGLPLERTIEIHVTGADRDPRAGEESLRDSMPMTAGDWSGLDAFLDRFEAGRARCPERVTLEYGGFGPRFEWRSDPRILRRDFDFLAARLHERGLR